MGEGGIEKTTPRKVYKKRALRFGGENQTTEHQGREIFKTEVLNVKISINKILSNNTHYS